MVWCGGVVWWCGIIFMLLLKEYGADATIAGNQGNCITLAQETALHGMLQEVEDGKYSHTVPYLLSVV